MAGYPDDEVTSDYASSIGESEFTTIKTHRLVNLYEHGRYVTLTLTPSYSHSVPVSATLAHMKPSADDIKASSPIAMACPMTRPSSFVKASSTASTSTTFCTATTSSPP